MLNQLSSEYSCNGSKFYHLLGVEIDLDMWKSWHYELYLPESMIFYHDTAPQPSYMSKPSSKGIGGLIGEAWSPSLHHLGRTLGSKNGFPSVNIKWMIAKTSSHHGSSHPSIKNVHTNFGLILTLLTIWVRQTNRPKWHPFPITCSLNHLKPEFLV